MSRRIDIELTSDRGDGTWNWRAAGAKLPKGTLDGGLLPAGATVGQVLRADVESSFGQEEVLAVLPPKEKNRAQVETLELISRPVRDEDLVTSKLAGKGGRDRGDRKDRRDRGERGERGDRGPRREGDRGARREGDRGPRRDGDRPRRDGERADRGPRTDRPRRERPAPPPKPKAKRLRPGRVHRKAAVDGLSAAEQVIAEQLLMGGIPAVRQAIEKQNEQARQAGGREVAAEPIVAIAERLLPDLKAAEWLDKAEAALSDLDELDLRDLRSVVVAADSSAKDEGARELAAKLRDGYTARLDREHSAWLAEIESTLAEGRVVRALRLSSRPPKAGAPLPSELATKLADAAGASLTADTLPDRWATVLDAVSYSPVRLAVAPASKPDAPSEELVAVVTRMAERVPKVAEAFGIEPKAPARRGRGGKGTKPPKPPAPKPTAAKAPEAVPSDAPAPAEAAEPPVHLPDETAPEEVSSLDLDGEVAEAPSSPTDAEQPAEEPEASEPPVHLPDETAVEEVSSLDLGSDETPIEG